MADVVDTDSEHAYVLFADEGIASEGGNDDLVMTREIIDLTSDHDDPEQYQLWMEWIHNVNSASVIEACLNTPVIYPDDLEIESSSETNSDWSDDIGSDVPAPAVIKGIVSQLEPLLTVADDFYDCFDLCFTCQRSYLKSTDNLPLIFARLGVSVQSAIFNDWTMHDYQNLYDFLLERIQSNDSRDDDRSDAFNLEKFYTIHPALIHRLQSSNWKVHLTSFYDYVMFQRTQGDGVVRNPYTNSALTTADISYLIHQYNNVASKFKLGITID